MSWLACICRLPFVRLIPPIGRTRFDRLFLIGRTSQTLCVDALKAAVAEAKRGKDPQRYQDAVECLCAAAPSEPEAVLDKSWINHIESSNKAHTHRLEAELKIYKNNLIKESIRVRFAPGKAFCGTQVN